MRLRTLCLFLSPLLALAAPLENGAAFTAPGDGRHGKVEALSTEVPEVHRELANSNGYVSKNSFQDITHPPAQLDSRGLFDGLFGGSQGVKKDDLSKAVGAVHTALSPFDPGYVIAGACAMIFQGLERATSDVDVFVTKKPAEVQQHLLTQPGFVRKANAGTHGVQYKVGDVLVDIDIGKPTLGLQHGAVTSRGAQMISLIDLLRLKCASSGRMSKAGKDQKDMVKIARSLQRQRVLTDANWRKTVRECEADAAVRELFDSGRTAKPAKPGKGGKGGRKSRFGSK